MKKGILIAVAVVLVGAGCANTGGVQTKQAESSQDTQTQENIMKRTLDNHEDLALTVGGAIIHTSMGDITVSFYGDDSPITVNNFLNLAKEGFYDGTSLHRVIKDFMIQGGDPKSKDQTRRGVHGTGDPGYKFEDEFNNHPLVRGSLAMANSGPNTNGSQFFIVTAEATAWLDGKHTNFGQVTAGQKVVDAIEAAVTDRFDNPVEPISINSVELMEKVSE